jgi:hypothetical protein
MRTLTIKGFKTDRQVQAFIDWYGHMGEQDFDTWLEYSDEETYDGLQGAYKETGQTTTDTGLAISIDPNE